MYLHTLFIGRYWSFSHFGEQKWNLARPVGFWLPVWELPHPKTLCWFNWSKAGLLIFPTGFLYIMMRHWRSTTQLKQLTQQTQQWQSIHMSQDVLVSKDPILPKKGRIWKSLDHSPHLRILHIKKCPPIFLCKGVLATSPVVTPSISPHVTWR